MHLQQRASTSTAAVGLVAHDDVEKPFAAHAQRSNYMVDASSSVTSDHPAGGWLQMAIAGFVGVALLAAIAIFAINRRRRLSSSDSLEASIGRASVSGKKYSSVQCRNTPAVGMHTMQPQLPLQQLHFPPIDQPVRIKTRGLLQRRGSSASLTIDLTGDPNNVFNTPPRECTAEDYLSSAGNRITRRQLRSSLNNTSIVHQEFLDIPLNHPSKSTVQKMSGCSNMNRYKSIWPNEKTRVVLRRRINEMSAEMSPESRVAQSYINANYIRGYDDEPMAFIAAQGCMPNTVDDFWMMVWQEKAPAIVMMTKLMEKNKNKCEAYLPAREQTYGSVHVQVLSCRPANGYYVRELQLTCDGVERQIKHFWFTSWPDQSAPTNTARQLLDMVDDVQSYKSACRLKHGLAAVGPIVVHCSAGIGRTGCFIAVCIGTRQIYEENMVDVLGIVCQMRLDRGGMIQTPEQYEFVHYTLAVYEQALLESPSGAQPRQHSLTSIHGISGT